MEAPNKARLSCGKCRKDICPLAVLCRFAAGSGGGHTTIHPKLVVPPFSDPLEILKKENDPIPLTRVLNITDKGAWTSNILAILHPNQKTHNIKPGKILCGFCKSEIGVILVRFAGTDRVFATFGKDETLINGSRFDFKKDPTGKALNMICLNTKDLNSLPTATGAASPIVYPSRETLKTLNLSQLVSMKPRDYQMEIFSQFVMHPKENSLICLPTGAGKTLIAAMIAKLMHQYPSTVTTQIEFYLFHSYGFALTSTSPSPFSLFSRLNKKDRLVLFLAPTIALVYQQADYLADQTGLDVIALTSEQSIDKATYEQIQKRQNVQVIVATIDLVLARSGDGVLPLSCFSVVFFDEAHRATGTHPYVKFMDRWNQMEEPGPMRPTIVAMTASPAADISYEKTLRKFEELCNTLGNCRVLNTSKSENLVQARPEPEFIRVPSTVVDNEILIQLSNILKQSMLFVAKKTNHLAAISVLTAQEFLQSPRFRHTLSILEKEITNLQNVDLSWRTKLDSIFTHSKTLWKMTEIIPVIGFPACFPELVPCMEALSEIQSIPLELKNAIIETCTYARDRMADQAGHHPKIQNLLKLVRSIADSSESGETRSIVFVHRRLCAKLLHAALLPEIRSECVMGRHGDGTLDEDRNAALTAFRNGDVELLVATSVLEEGIDVPSCNLVVRINDNLNLRAIIQSNGRARSRDAASKFVVLCDSARSADHSDTLKTAERNMTKAIHELASIVTVSDAQLIDALIGSLDEAFPDESKCAAQLHVFTKQSTVADIKELLEKSLSSPLIRVGKIRTIQRSDGDLVTVSARFTARMPPEKLQLQLQTKLSVSHWVSFAQSDPTQAEPAQPRPDSVACAAVTAGVLTSPNTFCPHGEILRRCLLEYDQKSITLLDTASQFPSRLVISIASVDRLMLACIEESGQTSIILPLLWMPTLETLDEHDWKRCVAPDTWPDLSCAPFLRICVTPNSSTLAFDSLLFFVNHRTPLNVQFAQIRLDAPTRGGLVVRDTLSYSLKALASLPRINLVTSRPLNEDTIEEISAAEASHPGSICHAIDKLSLFLQDVRFETFIDINPLIRSFIPAPKLLENRDPPNVVRLRSVLITPTCVIPFTEQPIMSNRTTRGHPRDTDFFAIVRFCDEDGESLHTHSAFSPVARRIKRIINRGFSIGDWHYKYLASSSSQLRASAGWFVRVDPSRPKLSVSAIRKWMGDFSKITSVSKLASRLGLALSSSEATIVLNPDQIGVVPDLVAGGYCFTDGCGWILREYLDMICKKLGLKDERSAIQVRLQGAKGVLARCEAGSGSNSGALPVQLRPSMVKFNGEKHTTVEVLSYTRPQACFLNRQIIMLLSELGVPDAVFEGLLQEHISKLEQIFVNAKEAISAIKQFVQLDLIWGFNEATVLRDPWARQLLLAIAAQQSTMIRNKAHIFVHNGRLLMGVADPSGLLAPNEVFIQITGSDDTIRVVVEPKVVVAKNPVLWPGDVAIVQAVDKPELRDLYKDCIVFSTRGDRPVPDKCSGSDLDGDLYAAIWEPLIVGPAVQKFAPLDHSPATAAPPTANPGNDPLVVKLGENFIANLVNSDTLGKIANVHSAVCDREGASSENSKRLALEFSKAVDYPKTGIPGQVPEDVEVAEYPDYLQKAPSYESQSILGKLYRLAKRLLPSEAEANVGSGAHGFAPFIENARQRARDIGPDLRKSVSDLRERYDLEIKTFMSAYGVRTEAELLSGCLSSTENLTIRSSRLVRQFTVMIRHLRSCYRSELDSLPHSDRGALVAVCYLSAFDAKPMGSQSRETTFLSFPWVCFGSELGKMLAGVGPGISLLGHRMRNWSLDMEDSIFRSKLEQAEKLRFKLSRALQCDVALFGSTAMLVHSPNSDFDFVALGISMEKGKKILRAKFHKCEQIPNREALKCEDSSGTTNFDVSFSREGVAKTILMQEYLLAQLPSGGGCLWPLARLLVAWARNAGLIGGGSDFALMPLVGFLWIFFQFCVEKFGLQLIDAGKLWHDVRTGTPEQIQSRLASGVEKLMSYETKFSSPGHSELLSWIAVEFMALISRAPSPLRVNDPLPGIEKPLAQLDDPSGVGVLSSRATYSRILLLWTADPSRIELPLVQEEEGQLCITRDIFLKDVLDRDFARTELEKASKCTVKFTDLSNGYLRAHFTSTDSPQGLHGLVQRALHHLYLLRRQIGLMPRSTKKVFVQGATCLLFTNSHDSHLDTIKLEPYPTHRLDLTSSFNKFMEAAVRQLSLLQLHYSPERGAISMIVRFGLLYTIGEPQQFSTTAFDLERGIAKGKLRTPDVVLHVPAFDSSPTSTSSSTASTKAPESSSSSTTRGPVVVGPVQNKRKPNTPLKMGFLSLGALTREQVASLPGFTGAEWEYIESTTKYYTVKNFGQVEHRLNPTPKMKRRAIRWLCADLTTLDPQIGMRLNIQTQLDITKSSLDPTYLEKNASLYLTRTSSTWKCRSQNGKWSAVYSKVKNDDSAAQLNTEELQFLRDISVEEIGSRDGIHSIARELWDMGELMLRRAMQKTA